MDFTAFSRSGAPTALDEVARGGRTARRSARHVDRASALFALDRHVDALIEYQRALRRAPRDATLHAYRADCWRALGRWRAARRGYRCALRLDRDLVHAHANLGALLLAEGNCAAALPHCERSAALDARNAAAWINLGQCRFDLQQYDASMQAYAQAYALDPMSSEICCRIAEVWRACGDHAQAAAWLQRAWDRSPGAARVKAGVAALLLEGGHGEPAAELYAELCDVAPNDIGVALGQGRALWEEGDAAAALAAFHRAAHLRPDLAVVRCHIADVLASIGDLRAAEQEHRAALTLNPRCVGALSGLATTLRADLAPADAQRLRALLHAGTRSVGARSALHSALAHYHDGIREHAAAARHAHAANRLHWADRVRHGWQYDPVAHAAYVDRLMAIFTPDLLRRLAGAGSDDARPVFVVGMPRSGTTLTEQILASHPSAFGIGESALAARSLQTLPNILGADAEPLALLDSLGADPLRAAGAAYSAALTRLVRKRAAERVAPLRIIDKMPENYELLGWLALLFPHARFLHVRRDPRDVALSCWMQRFGQIRWACDMGHIAARLVQHRRLMTHWRGVLGARLIEFDYEALVADMPGVTRRLLAALDLPWHDACLAFATRTDAVRTASVCQVRQPIYTTSVQRWRHYAAWLGPVLEHFPDHDHCNGETS